MNITEVTADTPCRECGDRYRDHTMRVNEDGTLVARPHPCSGSFGDCGCTDYVPA